MLNKVAVIGTVGVPANYGGFETLVENIIECNDVGFDVYCSSHCYKESLESYKGARLIYLPIKANGIFSVFYDVVSIIHATFWMKNSHLLILGVSGCIILPVVRLFSKVKIHTNIDGLEWRRDKWGRIAKWFLRFSEEMAVKYSDTVIADNKAIADYVQNEYGISSQVIAYGGDHAFLNIPPVVAEGEHCYSLALCRIEPENNVQMILEAFSRTAFKLKFIGNWDSSGYGKMLKDKYKNCPNIEILDPIYDINRLAVIRGGCHTYIHGHSAGGTNPSLVEMMHFSKPIYCFDCSYNRETTENSAGYFSSSEDLENIIAENNKEKLLDNSKSMKEIAERRYTWNIVKRQYCDLFR